MAVTLVNINGEWVEVPFEMEFQTNAYGEYPNISNQCASGEALFNVIDTGVYMGLAVQLTTSGTTMVDWGDNTINTFNTPAYSTKTSATALTAQVSHKYDANNSSGRGVWIESLGSWCYTVRIYNASSAIKYLKCARISTQYGTQISGVVWAEINIPTLTIISQMFSNGVSVTPLFSPFLKKVNLYSADNVTDTEYFAYGCKNFVDFNFPAMPLAVNRSYALNSTGFNKLVVSSIYTGTSSSSYYDYMSDNDSLQNVIFNVPNWGSVSSMEYSFENDKGLKKVILPAGVGNNKLTNCTNTFKDDTNLTSITNVEYLGSTTGTTTMSGTFDGLTNCEQELVINAKLSKISCKGTSNDKCGIIGLRLLNATSPFNGSSPQVDFSYTNMSSTAINQTLTDLPTVPSGTATVKYTGATGSVGANPSIATAKGWIVSN